MSFEFGEKLHSFLSNNPHRCDAVFAVGPQKKIVRTMRAILVIADPIFETMFENSWDHFIAKKKPIPLLDFDPEAFKVFIKLMVKNNVTTLKLKKMCLSPETLLNLNEICDHYSLTKLHEKLVALTEKTVFQNLPEFVKTIEFCNMSLKNVKMILSREELTKEECDVDIFEVAWKWCEFECERTGKPPTIDNVKQIFEASLPEIPMSDVVEAKEVDLEIEEADAETLNKNKSLLTYDNILKAAKGEELEIFQYLTEEEEQLLAYMKKIQWESRRNSLLYGPTLSFLNRFKIVDEPYDSDSDKCTTFFQTDTQIQITSFGFLGPVEEDSFFEIRVEVLRFKPYYICFSTGEVYKKLFVRKQKIMYVQFDEPIPVDATFRSEMNWTNYYGIRYSIKGPEIQNMSLGILPFEGEKPADRNYWFEENGVRFFCQLTNNPLVQIIFNK